MKANLPYWQPSIDKMVQRMLEQQSILQKEKVFLADSMADISHQMKTPLTSISLLLNLLQEEHLSKKETSAVCARSDETYRTY